MLWTLNPLVVGIGVLGAHIDVVAAALVVAAVAVVAVAARGGPARRSRGRARRSPARRRSPYAVVAVAVVAAWWVVGRRARGAGPAGAATLAAAFVVVAGALHLWAGPHVFDQLLRSRQAVSLATPWRPLLEWGRDAVGNGPTRLAHQPGRRGARGRAGGLPPAPGRLLRLSRPSRSHPHRSIRATRSVPVPSSTARGVVALWVTACLALAYALAAPYSLPWYDLLVWCALPALLPGIVDLVALVRLVALALAYVPGRVLGMTPAVEDLTLGVRRGVVPWVGLRAVGRRHRSPACGAGRGDGLGPRRAAGPRPPTR